VTAAGDIFTAGSQTATGLILTVAAGKTVSVGAVSVVLNGATLGPKRAAGNAAQNCVGTVSVETVNDLASTSNHPQLGGQVSAVSLNVATADRVVGLTNKPITVAFTIQTALAASNTVTINFPNGFITSATVTAVPDTFTAGSQTGTQVVLTVAASKTVAAGAVTVTLTGATIGGPRGASSSAVTVQTNYDLSSDGGHPAIGGLVTVPTLTIPAEERLASVVNRRIVVGFTLTTALVQSDTIAISFPSSPNSFVDSITNGDVTGIAAAASYASNTITLTVAAAGVTAGAKTVTICGVTLNAFAVDSATGIRVSTNKDYTTACSASGTVGTSQGTITDVSMTIPFANRIKNTAQSAVFAFTTSANIPAATCGVSNTVVLTVPGNFFASGTPSSSMTGYTVGANFAAGTITLSGTTALQAGKMTVTISGLTLGNPTAGSDMGVTVGATGHATSAGVPSGPISGYQVTKVTVSDTCQTSSACRTVTIDVSSAGDASTIASGGTLAITGLPFSGTPDAMYFAVAGSSRGTLVTSTAVNGQGEITLTVDSGSAAWSLGATATITLSGLTLTASAAFTASTISVGGSTPAYSATYAASSTGTTTTSPLALARAVPGTTNTQATVTFSTTNGIANNDVIRVYFPSGFFIPNAVTTDCSGSTSQAITATGLGSCNTLTVNTNNFNNGWIAVTYSGPGTAAGSQTLVLSGVSLSTTEKAATNGFYVVTTSSSCSAGGASTGTISNSNPGGPGAQASSAASAVLSAAVAVAVAVMLML